MPPVIQSLAGEILRKPKSIEIGRRSTPAIGITQAAYPVAEHLKSTLLRYLLRHTEMPSVLVFTRTKQIAKRLKTGDRGRRLHGRRVAQQPHASPAQESDGWLSAAASFRSWWRPTSPPAAWMSITSRT